MQIIEAFPRPICKFTWDKVNHEKLKKECYEIIHNKNYEQKNTRNFNLTHHFLFEKEYNNSKIKKNLQLLDNENFNEFKKWIEYNSVYFFTQVIGYDIGEHGVVVTECWLNVCDSGGKQYYHSHSNAFISGTYYVNYKKNLHSPLLFRSCSEYVDSKTPILTLKTKNNTKYNAVLCQFDYEEGDLLLWESDMIHGYDENENDDRISISFNVMPKYVSNGRYGFTVEKID